MTYSEGPKEKLATVPTLYNQYLPFIILKLLLQLNDIHKYILFSRVFS